MKNVSYVVRIKTITLFQESVNGVIDGSRFSFNQSALKFSWED